MAPDVRPLIVLAGPIHPDGHALLEREARVAVAEETEASVLDSAIPEAQGILFRSKPPCTERLMAACPRLRVVGRHGVGLDTVDLPAATRLGIAVVHAPGSNSRAVAEHTLMLILCCAKRTRAIDRMARARDWAARQDYANRELGGRTLGVVGVGNCGRLVARFAGALGMRVLGYDKYVPADEVRRRGAEPVASLEELLPQADILTCHVPLTPETHHMINEKTLALLRDGAVFINTSRGPVHEEPALFQALVTGRLAAAGLDVFEEEPSPIDNPLFGLDNVICSTHVAGVTQESTRTAALQVTGEMLRVLRGEPPHALGNPDVWPRPIRPR